MQSSSTEAPTLATELDAEGRVQLDVWLTGRDWSRSLREEARQGLTAMPKSLSPKWLYDAHGSQLFEHITRLPEYYPTRREAEILRARADDIAAHSAAQALVELGSGTSEKTRWLLDALTEQGTLQRFVPLDVSADTLRAACLEVAQTYPQLLVHGVVGDFERHLTHLPSGGRRLFCFLGGTIGNFQPAARQRFLAQLVRTMAPGDSLLLGTDLLKDRRRLHEAYNDSAGITAEFNLNVLAALNRELGARFDPQTFEHRARFDETHHWIEMLLVSTRDQRVPIEGLGLELSFARGEALRTEVSSKFTLPQVEAELEAAGLTPEQQWLDGRGDFALTFARKGTPRHTA